MNKLFSDLKTDEEKYNFFLMGRGYETGVIAKAIQNDVAMAYHRCAEYEKELQALRKDAGRMCRNTLLAVLGKLNSNPYSLTKSECIDVVREMFEDSVEKYQLQPHFVC